MTRPPLVFRTSHRVQYSDLDPYHHVGTAQYATYFVDHRMRGLRDYIGWDLATLGTLPFMVWTRRVEIDFVQPTLADQDITIISFVREFRGPDAFIECTMADTAGKTLARCLMVVAYVDKATNRGANWPAEVMDRFFEPGTS